MHTNIHVCVCMCIYFVSEMVVCINRKVNHVLSPMWNLEMQLPISQSVCRNLTLISSAFASLVHLLYSGKSRQVNYVSYTIKYKEGTETSWPLLCLVTSTTTCLNL